jgi:DNA-binding CsgD family transcriptional regulator
MNAIPVGESPRLLKSHGPARHSARIPSNEKLPLGGSNERHSGSMCGFHDSARLNIMKHASQIDLTDEERRVLRQWCRDRRSSRRLVLKCQIVLLAAKGLTNKRIASKLATQTKTVGRWRSRFAVLRLSGIERDATSPSPKPPIPHTLVQRILQTTSTRKPSAAPRWSTRTMAKEIGVSRSTVHRVWSANGLKPHLLQG